jgi:flagellar basal-body rod protein FlgF
MGSGIYVATAGAVAQANALDVTASNIANASTAGFHAGRVTFRQALTAAQSKDVAMVSTGTGAVDGTGGIVNQTGNPLDLAIDGDGYFAVDAPGGVRYTRDGAFQLGADGRVVTADGLTVRGVDGAAITVPPGTGALAVDPDGTVRADGNAVGQIARVRLDKTAITHDGDNLVASKLPPLAGAAPQVLSGALEGSNVNVVRGVVDLVKVSRTYESLLRVIEGYHECESRAAQTLGAPK